MDETILKSVAAQLRKPEGEYGVQTGEKMNQGNWHINMNAIEALRLHAGDNVLEIGMGNGFFVKHVLSFDPSIIYTGCDYSELMIAEALKINEALVSTGKASFHLANADQLPFADESFDKAFTINTIYFWDDPKKALAEIWRVLKPGAKLIIGIRPKWCMEKLPFVQYGFTMFTKEELEALLIVNHFTVIDMIEKEDPAVEMGGMKIPMAALLAVAEKS